MNALIDLSKVILNTQRLVLRPWRQADLQDFYEYAKVDGVGQMAGWLPHESIQVSQEILDHFIDGKKTFALQHAGQVIGSLGVETYNEAAYPELAQLKGRSIGYVLSKDFWGRGLMPEAVTAALEYLFTEEKLDFVMISHFEWNLQSKRVIEKCGFHYVKNTRHQTHYGTTEPTLEYILYNPAYKGERIYAES